MLVKRNLTLFSNFVEWFDFIVFAALATTISQVFLPKDIDGFLGLTITFMFFTITYVLRPIGGYLLGLISDKYGRVASFKISLLLMILGTLSIACAPSYQTIGNFSILLLLLARMAQAFSIGGEWVASSALVYESADSQNKFFMTSFVNSGIALGVITGSLTIFIFRNIFDSKQFLNFGWRIPFFISTILFLSVWLFRKKYLTNDPIKFSGKLELKKNLSIFIGLFFLLSFGGVSFYTFTVMLPTIFQHLHFSPTQSLSFTMIGVFAMMICEPLAGMMADKIGAIKVMMIGVCGILFFAFFHKMIIISGEAKLIYLAQLLFGMFLAMYMGITPGFLCSLLPPHNRCRVLGIIFH